MTEQQNNLANELLDELQRTPYLLRRMRKNAKHRLLKDEATQNGCHEHGHGEHGGHEHHGHDGPHAHEHAHEHDGHDPHGRGCHGHGHGEHDGHGKPHGHHEHHEHNGHGEHHGHDGHGGHGHGQGRHSGARGQARLLRLLLERDGILVKDIVEELDIRPSSASELITKLEKRGFVRTETDAEDKRAKRVYTTEKTREHSDQLRATHREMAVEALAGLSEQEQEQLLTLLRKIASSLETRPS
jgi:DNA-binding MarR family transcriptional regulator